MEWDDYDSCDDDEDGDNEDKGRRVVVDKVEWALIMTEL